MSYSTIKLYGSTKANPWKLIPSKLFKIESIADYLATFTPTEITKHQYVKQGLEIEVKLDLPQSASQPNADSGYKYLSIQNDGEKIAYYFIKRATWRSENCVRFELVMDVINTYTDGVDYAFKPNTRIIREHKSRFTKRGIYCNFSVNSTEAAVGSIAVGDEISFRFYNIEGEWETIGSGKLELFNGDDLTLIITNTSLDLLRFRRKVEDAIAYTELFQVWKNSSNYLELYFISMTESSYELFRKIDFVSEGINPLLIRDKSDNTIQDSSILNLVPFISKSK